MNSELKKRLIDIARPMYADHDPSHDFQHIVRVMLMAEKIARAEGADLDIVIPAALFHDVVNPPKNDSRSKHASDDSAIKVDEVLSSIVDYPSEKIEAVVYAVSVCSFRKAIVPITLEAKVLQDADMLESTGILSIMRTFASAGQLNRSFYDLEDPFCKYRDPDAKNYAIDLFYQRLLIIETRVHSEIARKIAKKRHDNLLIFLSLLKVELEELN